MNYTQNAAKLLAHVRTVDTTRSSPIFAECLRTRLTQTLLPGHQTTPHFTLTHPGRGPGIEFSEVPVVNRVVGKVGQVSQHLQLKI